MKKLLFGIFVLASVVSFGQVNYSNPQPSLPGIKYQRVKSDSVQPIPRKFKTAVDKDTTPHIFYHYDTLYERIGGISLPVGTKSGSKLTSDSNFNSGYTRRDRSQWQIDSLALVISQRGGGGGSILYMNGGDSGSLASYKVIGTIPNVGSNVPFTKTGDGTIAQFITDLGYPNSTSIPGGLWEFKFYASMSASGGSPQMFFQIYKYRSSVFTLLSTTDTIPISGGTTKTAYVSDAAMPQTVIDTADRIVVIAYTYNNTSKTTTFYTQDNNLATISTTFSRGISSLNGLTQASQIMVVDTTAAGFSINSVNQTHTFKSPPLVRLQTGNTIPQTGKISVTDSIVSGGLIKSNSAVSLIDSAILFKSLASQTTNGFQGPLYVFENPYDVSPIRSSLRARRTADRSIYFPDSSGTVALLDNIPSITGKLNISDTASMLSGYARSGQVVKYSDTSAMLSNRLKISDTTTMLGGYARTGSLGSAAYTASSAYTPANSETLATITARGSSTSTALTLNGDVLFNNTMTIGSSSYIVSNLANGFRLLNNAQTLLNFGVTDVGNATIRGSITAGALIKSGGTSSQFLKADGSVDASTYLKYSDTGRVATQLLTAGSGQKMVDSVAAIIPTGGIASGTYTPTFTASGNTSSATVYAAQYSRVGNVVTVSGMVFVNHTSNSSCQFYLSLPLNSAFSGGTNFYQLGGTCVSAGGDQPGSIQADAANKALFTYISTGAASVSFRYQYTYLII